MLNYDRILIFDFETTGLYSNQHQIIEIGAVLLERQDQKFAVTKELGLLVQADLPLSPEITRITNITDQMLKEQGLSQAEAFNQFFDLYQDEKTLLVAYNIAFDLSFLQAFIRKYWNPNYFIKNDLLDVMAIYRDRHVYPHRLENAVEKYGVNIKSTHRALDDVKATLEVLKAMSKEKSNLNKYINVLGYPKTYVSKYITVFYPYVRQVQQKGGYREIENL